MKQEDVFLAALDLPDAAERRAYLDEACAGDLDSRRRVEELLAAHFKPGAFLDEPLGEQLGVASAMPTRDDLADRGGGLRGDAALADESVEVVYDDLHFLEPSVRPDALGRIGHYEVLQVLGRGGFGIVFRAFDEVLQRVVALKALTPTIAATSPARKRFLREARSSAQVRHENVVQVYAVEEQPLPYLAMEFIPGETLQQRLDRTGPLEPREIARLGRQIAEGLAAAHDTGLIHRDIKPGNVLIESVSQRVKITDFGLARAADDASLTQSGLLAGTPMYMAPEQADGGSLDHRADLFSLGSVMYVMTTGRPPFRASTTYAVLKRLVEADPRPIREVIPETPQWLCDVISRLQSKKPKNRFQSAREVADLLADCEARLRANARLTDFSRIPRGRAASWRSRPWRYVLTVALLGLAAMALVKLAGLTPWPPSPGVAIQNAGASPVGRARPAVFVNSLGMKFSLIPAGTFMMGSSQRDLDTILDASSKDEALRRMLNSESPAHEVEITRPFYMGVTEVTAGQFRRFVEANPGYDVGDDRWAAPEFRRSDDDPVAWISWQNASDFCRWLGEQEARGYRLPTEAEWEYGCRAGSNRSRYGFGDDVAQLEDHAWHLGNSGGRAHRVGEKRPNAWGLYDMHGNVFEFCQDWHSLDHYKTGAVRDPIGSVGTMHVTRGGSWAYEPLYSRSAFRSCLEPNGRRNCIGFRVVIEAPAEGPGGDSQPGRATATPPAR